MARTHVILVTHTPERLRRTILGVARSSLTCDTITLSCDSDDPAIGRAAQTACAEAGVGLTLVTRAHAGAARSGQVRNNAVRSLVERGASDGDALVFFDGDCVPAHDAIERHRDLLARGELVLGWRFELTEAQTSAFDDDALRAGRRPFQADPEQTAAIARRHRRYRRQLVWRRLGLTKGHKPKLLSANFSCSVATYRRINGFDETYEGWGQEDDDFGRRVYASGGRPVIAIREVLAYHQHHPTRAPGDWSAGVNAARLTADAPTACARGLTNPLEQPPVRETPIQL